MTEQPELIEVATLDEVAAHARRDIATGDIGRVLDLMAVAEEIGGEAGAQAVYSDVIRPLLQARWDAWLGDEPGAADLTEDEMRMLLALAIENASPEQLEQILSLAASGKDEQ